MRAADPRSARTVAALREALRESLASHPLDEVSVASLCRAAGVQRTTFYTHAASVAELLAGLLTEEIDEQLDVHPGADASVTEVARAFQATLAAGLAVVARDRALFRAALDAKASAPLRRSITDLMTRRLHIALDIWNGLGVARGVDREVVVPFAAGALTASVETWALSDRTDTDDFALAVRDQMPPWWPRY
ncbi:TetR family transcriptional regulator [Labedella gwakjiensis]|uniref:TetR family transcriptional regulator n=1 Tax=Labedella gwakjiensis TaxID=390269 RepID=A0A2P8GZ23_9MICO|nr:TetR/AcrR family transcriptional regulator [Labedella gwakjiensis]PSL39200.1 TetR family transcriptional regulator [Labedella gwakjiensis]RUQ86369.1 TetR/AcrR family transcriptional regulator [Labedella gwakjiensis]